MESTTGQKQLESDNPVASHSIQVNIRMENVQEVINNLTINIEQGNEEDELGVNFCVITNVIVKTRDIVETTNISLPSLISVGVHCTCSRTWFWQI